MSQSNEPVGQPAPSSAPAGVAGESERTMKRRAPAQATWRARAEETLERDTQKALGALKKRPTLGVLLLGGLAVAAADAIGVGELAMGIAVGYAAYRVLHKDKPGEGDHAEPQQDRAA